MKESTAFKLVKDELDRAIAAHDPFNTPHEGFAVLQEEVDELWTEVKADGYTHRAASEAVQSAAMAIRYLIDLCGEEKAEEHEEKVRSFFRRKPTPDVDYDMKGRTGGGCYSG